MSRFQYFRMLKDEPEPNVVFTGDGYEMWPVRFYPGDLLRGDRGYCYYHESCAGAAEQMAEWYEQCGTDYYLCHNDRKGDYFPAFLDVFIPYEYQDFNGRITPGTKPLGQSLLFALHDMYRGVYSNGSYHSPRTLGRPSAFSTKPSYSWLYTRDDTPEDRASDMEVLAFFRDTGYKRTADLRQQLYETIIFPRCAERGMHLSDLRRGFKRKEDVVETTSVFS